MRIFSCVLCLPDFYSIYLWIFFLRVISCMWYLGLAAAPDLKEISAPVRNHWSFDHLKPAVILLMFEF